MCEKKHIHKHTHTHIHTLVAEFLILCEKFLDVYFNKKRLRGKKFDEESSAVLYLLYPFLQDDHLK